MIPTYNEISGAEIKQINRQRIFGLLYRKGAMTKQNIAEELNISAPTIAQDLKELERQNLIRENGYQASTGGRRAKLIEYNPEARYAIGLDISSNHLSVAIINLGVQTVYHNRMRLRFEDSERYFQNIGKIVKDSITEKEIDQAKILGIGISMPGHVSDDSRSVVYAPALDFSGGSIEKFEKYLDYPCTFTNDAVAACIAETWNEELHDNIIYLSLGGNVGGAIYLNNSFYQGAHKRSGEFGHMTLIPNGRKCYCGKNGCVHTYINANILSDCCYGDLALFFERLSHESSPETTIWNEYLDYLALTVNNIYTVFDCSIILGGYVGSYLEKYLPELQRRAATLNSFDHTGDCLKACQYKTEAAAVGASLLFLAKFIRTV